MQNKIFNYTNIGFEEFLFNEKLDGKSRLSLKQLLVICGEKLQNSITEEEAKKLIEASSDFSVAAFAVGSKAERTFIEWAKSLEDIFTTIHQSIEAINKFEQTQLGLDESIVPELLSEICTSFKNSGFSISRIDVAYPRIEVIYQIPLRQHAMQVSIATDLSKAGKQLEFRIHAFGNEEGDRWSQTAFLGSLLAHCVPGCAFSAGPPTINYLKPSGKVVSFSLKIDKDKCVNQQGELLLKHFGSMVKKIFVPSEDFSLINITSFFEFMDFNFGPNTALIRRLKITSLSENECLAIPEKVYEDALYFNVYAIEVAFTYNKYQKVIAISKATLLSLKKYDLKGIEAIPFYTSTCFLPDKRNEQFLKDANLDSLPSDCILKNVTLALLLVVNKDASTKKEMKELIEDPEIVSAFPQLTSTLAKLLP